jgi:hypothetical protein
MGKRVNRYSQTTRDANENPLVTLAARLGAAWWPGPPLDGWVAFRGVWRPVEIKTGAREGWADEYTPAQRRFRTWCYERHAPHLTWRNEADVMRDLGAKQTT